MKDGGTTPETSTESASSDESSVVGGGGSDGDDDDDDDLGRAGEPSAKLSLKMRHILGIWGQSLWADS